MNERFLEIDVTQAKLLANALRVKILSQLGEKPRTAKQVSEALFETNGNIHYHMMKLLDGGLIRLVEEKQVGGVTEKYYQSSSRWFNTNKSTAIDPVLHSSYHSKSSLLTHLRLSLNKQEIEELQKEYRDLLESWVLKTATRKSDDAKEYNVAMLIKSIEIEVTE
ncbi:ArsR/SmtB family transcription factor [Shouchella lehensis]|uniref:ArsR family transcriptional regulator n=1 Tax=Shouchella lehensis G1 TaxID=1246626 RepID=A0A060LP79_9BACI|nr:helix-turn-helix domain-containing protein [Shouchella lehensis]AIC93101.1 hypothetical protein BleG1_0493 [Shouchella lehensis G1]